MPTLRELILAAKLADLADHWLEARCCGATRLPLAMLADQRAGVTVRAVVDRLRCRQCGGKPASVVLIEHGAAGATGRGGSPEGWRLAL